MGSIVSASIGTVGMGIHTHTPQHAAIACSVSHAANSITEQSVKPEDSALASSLLAGSLQPPSLAVFSSLCGTVNSLCMLQLGKSMRMCSRRMIQKNIHNP